MYLHHDKHSLWSSTAAVFGSSHLYSRKGEQKRISMLHGMPKTLPTIASSAGRRALSGEWVLPALLFCIMGVAAGFAVWLMF